MSLLFIWFLVVFLAYHLPPSRKCIARRLSSAVQIQQRSDLYVMTWELSMKLNSSSRVAAHCTEGALQLLGCSPNPRHQRGSYSAQACAVYIQHYPPAAKWFVITIIVCCGISIYNQRAWIYIYVPCLSISERLCLL